MTARPTRLAAAAVVGLWAGPAAAMTLGEALATAYATNPQLASARAAARGTGELVREALAAGRPNVAAGAGVGDSGAGGVRPVGTLQATVPLWTAGRVGAAAAQARDQAGAGRAQLRVVERDVLLRAATAYADVLRARGALDAAGEHERALRADLGSAERRSAAGVATPTDVAAARSQLAAATARRVQAEGDLEVAREAFRAVVGAEPDGLSPPPPAPDLPATRERAVAAAADDPGIAVADRNLAAARSGAEAALAQLRPSLAAQATSTVGVQPAAPAGVRAPPVSPGYQAGVLLTVPAYDGGLAAARVRAAREDAGARRLDLDAARRDARRDAVTAWQTLATARAGVAADTARVGSARASRDGVRRERDLGLRTELQVVQAEQEVVDAELALLGARRDAVVAGYQLLAATGRLSARGLGLPVEPYDPAPRGAAAGEGRDLGTGAEAESRGADAVSRR